MYQFYSWQLSTDHINGESDHPITNSKWPKLNTKDESYVHRHDRCLDDVAVSERPNKEEGRGRGQSTHTYTEIAPLP